MKHHNYYTKLYFIASYLLFGLLHELSHVAIATILLPNNYNNDDTPISQSLLLDDSRSSTVVTFLARAILGRYCSVTIANRNDNDDNVNSSSHHIAIIQHFGWIFSTSLAITLHYCYRRRSSCRVVVTDHGKSNKSKHHEQLSRMIGLNKIQPIVIIAAYITAVEAISTDLFSFGISVFNQVSVCSLCSFASDVCA